MKTILAAAFALAAVAADAATITKTTTAPDPAFAVLDVLAPTSTTGGFLANQTGSVSGVRRSPYDTVAGLQNSGKYHSVQAGGTATYLFGRDQSSFSLLWGSPDDYNTLSFFNDDAQIDLSVIDGVAGMGVKGSEIATFAPASPQGLQFANVTFSGFLFDKVVFASGKNAFEYGLVSATPVPLPAAAWLLLAAIGGLGVMSRRRAA